MTHATTDAVVEVTDLGKRYGHVTALDDVTFDIRRGETFALLGPNGAGKSTTIEILEGYRARSSGEARVLGQDPGTGGLAWKARLGIVLQASGETGSFTPRELLRQTASLYSNPRDVDDVLDAVGLAKQATTLIRKLSGGQRRRVDVGLGIVGRPELLFLDEPTTGFDPEARRQFWGVIDDLKREGTTILLTTHDLHEAARLSDRGGVIAGGRMVALGPIDELGGADARTPIVRWRSGGKQREERTHEPAAFVRGMAGEPERLEIIRPSLEDVYLGLIGEHHRETDAVAAASTTTGVNA